MIQSVKKYVRPVKWLLKYGGEVSSERGRIKQLIDMYRCMAAGYSPSHYYYWKLYRGNGTKDLGGWVPQREAHQFSRLVSASIDPVIVEALLDKRLFESFCRSNSLPAIEVLASVECDTTRNDFMEYYSSLRRELFAKPVNGLQAMGAMKFSWDGKRHIDIAGKSYDSNALFSWCNGAVAEHGPYVLQPIIHNHESLEDLSGGSLVCIRVLTYAADGPPQVAVAMMSMPAERSHVSNFSHDDALGAPVDRSTGILGGATLKSRSASPAVDYHPSSGGQIAGRQLPLWGEVVELVCRAHSTFGRAPMIGWDVAITPDGPLLIEGNLDMGVESLQVVHGTPLQDFFDFRGLVRTFNFSESRGQ